MISQDQKIPLAGRPSSVRIASYSVLGILATVFTSSVMPPVFTSTSVRAVVNAPIKSITSPISGIVTDVQAMRDQFPEGPVAVVENERIDRSTFIGLQVESTSLRNELTLKRGNLEDYRRRIKDLETELAIQRLALIARTSNALRDAEVALNLATYSAENEKLDSRRKLLLVSKGVFPGTKDELVNKIKWEDSKIEAARIKVAMSADDLDFAQRGIYVGDNNQYLQNLQNEIRARTADVSQIDMQIASIGTRLAELQNLTDSENRRIGKLANAEIGVAPSEKIYKAVAQAGKQVNAGDTLVQTVDCKEAFVVAIFSERQAQALSIGSKVLVESDAWAQPVHGMVTRLLPRTTDRVDLDYAVPFPPTERRELYAFVVPENADADTAKSFCSVGTWVEVERPWDWPRKAGSYLVTATASFKKGYIDFETVLAGSVSWLASTVPSFSNRADAAEANVPETRAAKTAPRDPVVSARCPGIDCRADGHLLKAQLEIPTATFTRQRTVADTQKIFQTRWN
ncbi:HlyD family efflux transporter periplasmic adaptor subunit [Phyllobacterium lublinensis]|uniref:HlyD family efflux transporter periplasmic adaptor subunit n=1 Tax=Phyllobacterium lublinensis TaxID=2875708 RepID=UPI001CD03BD1|nr:HlyD family efflux transporter periplasmic adaptor subunit [Phyllobacterium sp. 2063]MBZ9655772.1 HlyD family secretion protein [Phyllobacterium sp. 2063]